MYLFGYTLAREANFEMFKKAQDAIVKMGFLPDGQLLENVDGGLIQLFINNLGQHIRLENDCQVDCVSVVSDVELPIDYIYTWEPTTYNR